MSWTDERVETLKKLWQEGLSASQIAAELGSVTRNAVIGKVHRLGMSGRGQPVASAKRQRRAVSPQQQQSVERKIAKPPVTIGNLALKPEIEVLPVTETQVVARSSVSVVPISKRLTIEKLTERTCKWPIGDPSTEDFHFCGCSSIEGLPYCEYHAGVAYQGIDLRKRVKRFARG
ncbi:GcrA cell cycle regulator [Faunimonas pinastri]|uniref:GcrA cell cycle regulator n=1 Tax=Faunimonas pinastri TaxID=1855383 RepID=A0A1H8ZGT2_9HYPH|nr:GcrA family cell cycle regulator [Faunimonas pinastri]SEP63553.1 GcrA cell cycle regulator [Faunimonas pinastri]